MRSWVKWFAAVLLGLSCAVPRVEAAPAFYEFSLTPSVLGAGNPFGISALPAGPFIGSFSFDDSLLASGSNVAADHAGDVLSFDLTIGDTTWSVGDVIFFGLGISGGVLQQLSGAADDGAGHVIGFDFGINPNDMWNAFDGAFICAIADPTFPGCLLGSNADTTLERQATVVAEPAALPLFALAAAGLMLALRRRDAGNARDLRAR